MTAKNSNFAARLRSLLDLYDISQVEFAKAIGVNKGNITHYLKGDYEAKQDVLYNISKRYNVSPAWLMGYDVPMSATENVERTTTDIAKLIDLCNSRPG